MADMDFVPQSVLGIGPGRQFGSLGVDLLKNNNVIPGLISGSKAMSSGNPGSDPTSGYNGYDPTGFDQAQWQYDQQLKLDEMERQFNSAEAQKTRDWQENLANTAYQRAVADIKKAGLNPWLALNGGSLSAAATPSGAQASASSGRSSVPNPTIYKAYLQLIGQLVSSIGSIFKLTGKF